jgi:aryl-alcohol dehydrogenase-like predicted oxidoreductase
VEQRKLGTQGPALSVVGIGTWAIGGDNWDYGWGPQEDADSLRAIQAAFDLGVNWVDTAPVYGFGHAEEVVAKALKGRRDGVVLASKFGPRRWKFLSACNRQLAVAWTLANPAVTSAIVGFRNGEEPADLLNGRPGPLEPATMAALRADQV